MRQREKGFIANAAHELRTPIAALGINLALLKKRLTAHTNSDLIEALGSGIERSGRLVSQLLSLARTDSDITVSRKATVNLQQLAQESLAQIMPIADLKNVEIFLEAPHSVWIQGDAESLRTMIENLIENAVKYTTHSSIVSVLVKQIAEQIILQVSDSGPGIAEVDRERVFNRFFRLPNHKEIGSGLGLAIVKAVVDKHDGLIRLNTSSHGGLLVEITFPH